MGVSTPEKKLQRSKPNLNQNLKISKWVLISNPKNPKPQKIRSEPERILERPHIHITINNDCI